MTMAVVLDRMTYGNGAYAEYGYNARNWLMTLQRIKAGFDAEWASPTDIPTGR